MPDLTLYRVDGRKRLNLEGVVADGVEFYTAEADPVGHPDGTIILSPVRVVTTTVKRTETSAPDASTTTDDPEDPAPFV